MVVEEREICRREERKGAKTERGDKDRDRREREIRKKGKKT